MSSILVDTSVWIRHFKDQDSRLVSFLNAGHVVTHEFVIEELMLGGLGEKDKHLHLLHCLHRFTKVTHDEVVKFIALHGRKRRFRVGLVDSYLLCACLVHEVCIYSDDRGLMAAAEALGVAC